MALIPVAWIKERGVLSRAAACGTGLGGLGNAPPEIRDGPEATTGDQHGTGSKSKDETPNHEENMYITYIFYLHMKLDMLFTHN